MKKVYSLILATIMLVINLALPVLAEEATNVPDYSVWKATTLTGATNATQWVPTGTYDDFVLEYTIQTSNWATGWMWYQLRQNTGKSTTNVRYASRNSDGVIIAEPVWASNQFTVGDTKIGNVSDNEAHKMRVYAEGKTIIVEEYINGVWVLAIAFEQTNYDETLGGGTIKFSSANAFTLTDVNIYERYESAVPDYTDWQETSLTGATNATSWVPTGTYDDFVLEYTIETSNWAANTGWMWYQYRMNADATTNVRYGSRKADGVIVGESAWGSNNFVAGDAERGNVSDNEAHIMRVCAIGEDIIVEEKLNGEWAHVITFKKANYDASLGGGTIKFSSNFNFI